MMQKGFKRAGFIILGCCFLLSVGGCKSISDKFIRKPKDRKIKTIIPDKTFHVDPRLAYERHFVFVKVWMDEFRSAIDSNSRKRLKESFEQTMNNLMILYEYFPDEYQDKKDKLQDIMNRFKRLYDEVKKARVIKSPLTSLKNKSDALRREFDLLFWPSKQPEGLWEKLNID